MADSATKHDESNVALLSLLEIDDVSSEDFSNATHELSEALNHHLDEGGARHLEAVAHGWLVERPERSDWEVAAAADGPVSKVAIVLFRAARGRTVPHFERAAGHELASDSLTSIEPDTEGRGVGLLSF